MLDGEYLEAKRLCESIASGMEPPLFYVDKMAEVGESRAVFETDPMVGRALAIVEERGDVLGHGLSHARKVAVDAGALVLIETAGEEPEGRRHRTLLLAHLAGALHDIRREQPEHAQRGADEAAVILEDFDLGGGERAAIVQAIRNHEAFKPATPLEDPALQLLSDALYDADKFRWGPDNFTETVWNMVAPFKVPLSAVLGHFDTSMRGIERISGTFRTATGREYGPDFIAKGLLIGERLYRELSRVHAGGEGVRGDIDRDPRAGLQ